MENFPHQALRNGHGVVTWEIQLPICNCLYYITIYGAGLVWLFGTFLTVWKEHPTVQGETLHRCWHTVNIFFLIWYLQIIKGFGAETVTTGKHRSGFIIKNPFLFPSSITCQALNNHSNTNDFAGILLLLERKFLLGNQHSAITSFFLWHCDVILIFVLLMSLQQKWMVCAR